MSFNLVTAWLPFLKQSWEIFFKKTTTKTKKWFLLERVPLKRWLIIFVVYKNSNFASFFWAFFFLLFFTSTFIIFFNIFHYISKHAHTPALPRHCALRYGAHKQCKLLCRGLPFSGCSSGAALREHSLPHTWLHSTIIHVNCCMPTFGFCTSFPLFFFVFFLFFSFFGLSCRLMSSTSAASTQW